MPGSKTFNIKGKAATEIYRPNSIEKLIQIVTNRDGLTLVPVGGKTQLDLGDTPTGDFAALHLVDAFHGKIDHEPADLTVVLPANTTLGKLQATLMKSGQRLPIDPPNSENATIGGILAVGIGGPLQSRFGPPRDWVLGMSVLRADGELVRAGGRVVKNVTGYDLMRLWCGSLGTIGLITEVALRVTPVTETEDYSLVTENFEEAHKIVEQIYKEDIRPECSDILINPTASTLFLRLPKNVRKVTQSLINYDLQQEQAGAMYLQMRDLGFTTNDDLTIRISCTNSTLKFIIAKLQQMHPDNLLIRPLSGLIRATWKSKNPQALDASKEIPFLRKQLQQKDTTIIIERSPKYLDDNVDTWGPTGISFKLMRKIKNTYDPDGRFNRGRYFGGI
jgi:glycolate oxidase FAD binding subunit